jgi:hypothetical protein
MSGNTVDRRLEQRFAALKRIASDRRIGRGLTGRSQAATRNASELLRQAFPAARFEIGSCSFDQGTFVQIISSSGPGDDDVKRVLAPLTVGARAGLQLHHEWEIARRSRLALRAAYQVLAKDLELSDTPETLGAKLTEKLRDIIPSREGRLSC